MQITSLTIAEELQKSWKAAARQGAGANNFPRSAVIYIIRFFSQLISLYTHGRKPQDLE